MLRTVTIRRETAETAIDLSLNLDGTGQIQVSTGVGFFDHMLTHIGKHGLIDLTVNCTGDLHIDAHHTVEDVGICFGKALAQALSRCRPLALRVRSRAPRRPSRRASKAFHVQRNPRLSPARA